MLLNKEDVYNCKMLKTIIDAGDFQLKGNAVVRAAFLFDWFQKFPERLEETIKKDGKPKIKKMKDS